MGVNGEKYSRIIRRADDVRAEMRYDIPVQDRSQRSVEMVPTTLIVYDVDDRKDICLSGSLREFAKDFLKGNNLFAFRIEALMRINLRGFTPPYRFRVGPS